MASSGRGFLREEKLPGRPGEPWNMKEVMKRASENGCRRIPMCPFCRTKDCVSLEVRADRVLFVAFPGNVLGSIGVSFVPLLEQ